MPRGSSDGWLPPEDGTITREQYHRARGTKPGKPMTGVSSLPTKSQRSKPAESLKGILRPPGSESTRAPSGSSPDRRASSAERRTVRARKRAPAPLPPRVREEPTRVVRPDPLETIRGAGEVPTCQACDSGVPADWVYRLPPEPNAMGKPGQRLTLCGRHAAIAVKAYVGGTLIPGEAVWGDAARVKAVPGVRRDERGNLVAVTSDERPPAPVEDQRYLDTTTGVTWRYNGFGWHVLHTWTQRDGSTWECDAYDHGPFCRQCRRLT